MVYESPSARNLIGSEIVNSWALNPVCQAIVMNRAGVNIRIIKCMGVELYFLN
jgi:hypothetical protein